MHTITVCCGAASRFGLILFLTLGASGCKPAPVSPSAIPTCGDKIVDVDSTVGAKPEAVYVCKGDTVTWNPNGLTFTVEFKKDSPFEGDPMKFDDKHNKSPKTKSHKQLKVYEYLITVNGTKFDPQVIGGGGN
jgi:plastocyanin